MTGNNLTFGVTLKSKDDSAPGFRSFMSGFSSVLRTAAKPIAIGVKLAGGGLGLLRDINQGLVPLLRGTVDAMDSVIERGAGFDGLSRSFKNLSGGTAEQAERWAGALQNASNKTLRFVETVGFANDALSNDIPLDKLQKIIEFATAKATSIRGGTTQGVLGGILQGLGRASPMVLKDFGIDLEFVADQYDRMKGVGAFDSLDFASRRAMIMQAAMERMADEVKRLNVDAGGVGFLWQQVKTDVVDSVDRLSLMVVRTGAMRETLTGVRDIIEGITQHLKDGGSIWDVITGKGKSGGLLGLLKGGLSDLGGAIGRGLTGTLLIGAAKVGESVESLWDKIKSQVPGTFGPVFTEVTGTMVHLPTALGEQFDSFIEMLKDAFKTIVGWFDASWDFLVKWIQRIPGFKPDPVATTQPAGPPPEPPSTRAARGLARVGSGVARGAYNMYRAQYGGSYEQSSLDYYNQARNGTANYYPPMNQQLGIAHAVMMMMHGMPDSGGKSSMWDTLRGAGSDLLTGGVFGGDSAASKELAAWRAEFAAKSPESIDPGELPTTETRLLLSKRGISDRQGRRALLERERRRISILSGREARAAAGQWERRKRAEGFNVLPSDRDREEDAIRDRLVNQRTEPILKRRDAIDGELKGSQQREMVEWKNLNNLISAITGQTDAIGNLVAAIGGTSQRLATVTAKR